MTMKATISLLLLLIFGFLIIFCIAVNVPCPPIKACHNVTLAEVCLLDENEGCIRKYSSECLMKVMTCQERIAYADFSNEYCSMDTYFCETDFERWTIFFGNEKFI